MKTDHLIYWVEATIPRRRWTHSPWLTVVFAAIIVVGGVAFWRWLR